MSTEQWTTKNSLYVEEHRARRFELAEKMKVNYKEQWKRLFKQIFPQILWIWLTNFINEKTKTTFTSLDFLLEDSQWRKIIDQYNKETYHDDVLLTIFFTDYFTNKHFLSKIIGKQKIYWKIQPSFKERYEMYKEIREELFFETQTNKLVKDWNLKWFLYGEGAIDYMKYLAILHELIASNPDKLKSLSDETGFKKRLSWRKHNNLIIPIAYLKLVSSLYFEVGFWEIILRDYVWFLISLDTKTLGTFFKEIKTSKVYNLTKSRTALSFEKRFDAEMSKELLSQEEILLSKEILLTRLFDYLQT